MISVTPIFIMVASSATVTNSVSFRMLFSFSSCSSSACNFCWTASRLSRRCLEVCDFPLLPNRAKVSLICLSTSSSEISVFSFFFFFSFFSFFLFSSILVFFPGAGVEVEATSNWTFSSWRRIRALFLRVSESPPSLWVSVTFSVSGFTPVAGFCNLRASFRSRSFSCRVFLGGRVRWLIASRSMEPTTFTSFFIAGWLTLKGSAWTSISWEVEFSGATIGASAFGSSGCCSASILGAGTSTGACTLGVCSTGFALCGGFRSIWSTTFILFSSLTSSFTEINSSSSSSFSEDTLPALSIVTVSFFLRVFFRSTRVDSFFTSLSVENSFATRE